MKLASITGKQKGVTVAISEKDDLFLPASHIRGVLRFKQYVRIWTLGVTLSVKMDTESEAARAVSLIRKELGK
jgi:hypothetical protein